MKSAMIQYQRLELNRISQTQRHTTHLLSIYYHCDHQHTAAFKNELGPSWKDKDLDWTLDRLPNLSNFDWILSGFLR